VTVRIGLTGPIGCGKSTVAGWLGERPGVVVIDADQVAREVVELGELALEAVFARFGDELRREDGSLDRGALGRIVFADPAALRDLEAITHPAVRTRILAAIAEAEAGSAQAVVIEAIKLVEGGLATLCDEVWLVTCDPIAQRDRLVNRGLPEAEADQRIAAQAGLSERLDADATRIIDTSGTVAETRAAVERQLDTALADRGASMSGMG
jgi:dephospho-CoA kinase